LAALVCRREPLSPKGPADWSRLPIAQLRYDADNHLWTLYWADRNDRWHRYDDIDSGTADELLDEINDDPTCIFWG
jgi:hypothetical protein